MHFSGSLIQISRLSFSVQSSEWENNLGINSAGASLSASLLSSSLIGHSIPELVVLLDPHRLLLQSSRAQLAGPHAPDLLGGDQPGLLQHADVLLHACERHVELLGKVRDGSVGAHQLPQNAASGGVRERGEGGIEVDTFILNHMVHYSAGKGSLQAQSPRLFPRLMKR